MDPSSWKISSARTEMEIVDPEFYLAEKPSKFPRSEMIKAKLIKVSLWTSQYKQT